MYDCKKSVPPPLRVILSSLALFREAIPSFGGKL